jgi:short-subunit dehydrogenase
MTSFAGSHVWIIGASTGIGRALAIRLAREGAVLSLYARNSETLEDLRRELNGPHAIYPLDVTRADQLEAAAAAQPRIDRIVFLAGQYEPGALADADPHKTRLIVDTNLMGALHTVHAVLPVLRRQRGGQIALCGSVAGYRGLPGGQPYSATKAAIINLAESLRTEESKHNIDIRLISPGFVKTPMTDKNTFPMPMMISADQAADAIATGLKGPNFEIHFPRRMTIAMKILQILPYWLYFKIAGRL